MLASVPLGIVVCAARKVRKLNRSHAEDGSPSEMSKTHVAQEIQYTAKLRCERLKATEIKAKDVEESFFWSKERCRCNRLLRPSSFCQKCPTRCLDLPAHLIQLASVVMLSEEAEALSEKVDELLNRGGNQGSSRLANG